MRLLEYLRNQAWYKPVVTSWIFLLTLRVFPRRVSYRLLKRLGPVEVKIRVGPHTFWIVTSSEDDHYLEALVGGLRGWETESLKTWAALCSRGGTVVDVGAYGGVYTALAIVSGAEKVIAYEPNPEMFDRLKSTVERNDIGGRCVLRERALSDVSGPVSLMVLPGRPSTSGAHLESVESDTTYEWVKGGSVCSSTFDDEIVALEIESVAAMKIDVEGLEAHVLRGAESVIKKSHPALIIECLQQQALDAVKDLLWTVGYTHATCLEREQSSRCRQTDGFSPGNFLLE